MNPDQLLLFLIRHGKLLSSGLMLVVILVAFGLIMNALRLRRDEQPKRKYTWKR